MKHWQKQLLRLGISSALIAFLLTKVIDVGAVVSAMTRASLIFLLLAFAINIIHMFIQCYKWQVVSRLFALRVPFKRIVSLFWAGSFFNLFLPGTVGGDVFRGYGLSKHSGKAAESAVSVLMDRLIGLFTLVVIALVALMIGYQSVDMLYVGPVIAVTLSIVVLLFTASVNTTLAAKLQSLATKAGLVRLGNSVRQVSGAMNMVKDKKRGLVYVLFISTAFHLLGILMTYLISLAIGIELSIAYFFILIPAIWVIVMIPISIGRIGVQDGACVLFFSQVGVSPALAISFSFLWHIIRVITSLPGGMIYARGGLVRTKLSDSEMVGEGDAPHLQTHIGE